MSSTLMVLSLKRMGDAFLDGHPLCGVTEFLGLVKFLVGFVLHGLHAAAGDGELGGLVFICAEIGHRGLSVADAGTSHGKAKRVVAADFERREILADDE